MDLESIYGVGEKSIALFSKLQLYTIQDFLEYYPFRYAVYRVLPLDLAKEGEDVTIKGVIETEPKVFYINKRLNRMTFRLLSDGRLVNITIFNRAFYKKNLKLGREIYIVGKYKREKNLFTASDIKFQMQQEMQIEPIYHLVQGIKQNQIYKVMKEILAMPFDLEDYIPPYLVSKYGFLSKEETCKYLHMPTCVEEIKKAKMRGIYEEFFVFMFKMQYLKYKYNQNNMGLKRVVDRKLVDDFIVTLPFTLTNDQLMAVNEIYEDLCSEKRMNRLILGDVGSGKTCVAALGMYINYLSGYQSSLMAPTEILAEQHYESMKKFFASTSITVGLLVGSMKKSEKNKVYKMLIEGKIDILVGTHALLSEGVTFQNLGLVITDEQHRFGVNQRSLLQNKGGVCDVLYLSATPIPRTYALTLYGDMETSLIKTKPSGRKEIFTKVVKEKELKSVLESMYNEIKKGHQIYVVAPLIEDETGESSLIDVTQLKEKFSIAFQNKVIVEILHGKMKNEKKEEVMEQFKKGEIKVLISTTVIEVGVDVKNATMMVIFNAERFGLATLHQLRGRVGRNAFQSFCYLISDKDIPRLQVLEESNDGFYISEKDFELRGEGDLFGTRQSGDMIFKLGNIKRDYKILVQCKKDVIPFIEENINTNFKNYPQFLKIIKEIDFLD